jgi:hypothetical protein
VQLGTGFYEWPIWQAYPTWQQFHIEIANEREAARKENREAHKATQPPPLDGRLRGHALYGEGTGMSAAIAKINPGKGTGWPWT